MQEPRRGRRVEFGLLPLSAAATLLCAAISLLPKPAQADPKPNTGEGRFETNATEHLTWRPPRAPLRSVPLAVRAAVLASPPPPPPKGTTVLHIGDSFAGALGIPLNRQLEQFEVRSVLRYQTASFIPNWAWGKLVSKFVANFNPDLILVTLGANELEIVEPQTRAGAIRRLVAQFEGRPCVWIAPPLWEPDTGLLEVIRDSCAPCRFMDTNALIRNMARMPDGVHPTMEAREAWAALVLDWLARERRATPERPWHLPAR
jgi:hypothetical protein